MKSLDALRNDFDVFAETARKVRRQVKSPFWRDQTAGAPLSLDSKLRDIWWNLLVLVGKSEDAGKKKVKEAGDADEVGRT